jgi:hypothetical protein
MAALRAMHQARKGVGDGQFLICHMEGFEHLVIVSFFWLSIFDFGLVLPLLQPSPVCLFPHCIVVIRSLGLGGGVEA